MVFSPPPKTSWDKQAWFRGLFLGNFAGLLLLCACHPISRRLLESAFPYTAFGYYTGDLAALGCLVLGMIVAPTAVSVAARRSYALWGVLPLSLFTVWLVASLVVAASAASFANVWVATALCWVVTSCPIALVRYRRQQPPRPANLTPSPVSLSQRQRHVTLTASLATATVLVILGWYNLKHPIHFSANMQARWLSGKETRVPLIERGNNIYV